ncbi:MAG: LCP family protein [Chloroflexia bacterium]
MPQKRRPKSAQKFRYAGQRTNNPTPGRVKTVAARGEAAHIAPQPVLVPSVPSLLDGTPFMSATMPAGQGEAALPLAQGGLTGVATPINEARPRWRQSKPWTVGRIVRWALGALGIVLLALGGYGVYLFIRFQGSIFHELPPTPTALIEVLPPQPTALPGQPTPTVRALPTPDHVRSLPAGRFNILVLGTDKRPNDPDHSARSDSLVLVNVDRTSRTVRLMSVPRDLIVDIPDYGLNKVNAAYLFGEYYKEPGGGQALSLRSLSNFFDVAIDYYVTVNFDGFRTVVDTIGGIDVQVPYEMDDFDYPSDDEGDPFGTLHLHFDEGWQHMDGKTALRYARTRHADNDFARSKRQLQIVMAIRQKALSLDLLPSVPSIMDQLGGMVETNIPWEQQLGLAQLGFGLSASSIMTASIDGTLVTGAYLPDGGEGLKLDWDAAQPMLDEFFGFDTATPTPARRATPTRTAVRR